MMMGAVALTTIAWFGVRRAQTWAVWSAFVASAVPYPFFAIIAATYTARGVPLGESLFGGGFFFFWVLPLALVAALALGILGNGQGQRPALAET